MSRSVARPFIRWHRAWQVTCVRPAALFFAFYAELLTHQSLRLLLIESPRLGISSGVSVT